MPEQKATVATGGIVQQPVNVQYKKLTDPRERAVIVAHLIRIGQRPPVGVEVGFSRQMKQGFIDEVVAPGGEIDALKAVPLTEKIWCCLNGG